MDFNRGVSRYFGLKHSFVSSLVGILAVTALASAVSTVLLIATVALIRDGEIDGYQLPGYTATSGLTLEGDVALVLAALLPIAFLVSSTLVFTRRLSRKINTPLDELKVAVAKIANRDLDFGIAYDEPNELGDLCRAFVSLRQELQEYLEGVSFREQRFRDMMATLSHDLRTPATVIWGHVDSLALAGETRSERLDRYLPILEASSRRMVELLQDMAEVITEVEQPDLLISPTPVKLEEELARKARVYELRAAECGVSFSFRVLQQGEAARDTIELDLHRLEQVLDNLFDNALRFTPSGGRLTVSLRWSTERLYVSVSDTGPGISPEDQPHVFEKAYRGATGTGTNACSGLGLFISRLLVEKQGGRIAVRNHLGGGCEAEFWLPLQTLL